MTENERCTPSENKEIKTPKEFLQSIMEPGRLPTVDQQFLTQLQERRGNARSNSGSSFSGVSFAEIGWNHLLDEGEGNNLLDQQRGPTLEKAFFKRRLTGKILIDLGGGYPIDCMWEIARKFDSSTLINVDRYSGFSPPDPLKPKLKFQKDEYSEWSVHADMLDFISRVRSNIANCTINGIDDFIVNDYRYHEAMAEEMVRVTDKGGLIFGYDSDVEPYLSRLAEKTKPSIRRILFAIEKGKEKMEISPKKVERGGSSVRKNSLDKKGFIFEKI